MSEGGPSPLAVRTRADLGRELTALRLSACFTVRELARRVDAPAATLGDYFSGAHLPKPSQLDLYRAVLRECGVADGELSEWERALERARRASDGRATKTAAPYRGLEPFGEADADLFFGREAVMAQLLARLRELCDDPGPSNGILALVGPSGSGKSSVLGGGLAPAVRSGSLSAGVAAWECVLTTPAGALDVLRASTTDASIAPERPTLLVVDQFEELWATPSVAGSRAAFLDALSCREGWPEVVVIGLRADFYGPAATEPVVAAALRHAQVLLGPMTEAELRAAITEPAHAVGASVEDGLVDLLLADLAPGSAPAYAHQAGSLPLLSHALLVTWLRARHNRLTIADYRAAGGLGGAVRQSAEELFGSLSSSEQEIARQVFARLVQIDPGGPLTRRRVRRQGLVSIRSADERPEAVDRVVERFVSGRLLTANADTVEISHEALLTAWPRLAGWVDADRAGLRVHHQLSDAAEAWEGAGRDDALLWRGTPLEHALEWAAQGGHDDELNRTERHFLESAVAQRDAQRRAARRRTRRVRQLMALVATLAVVASLLAAYAFEARASAERTRDRALSRQVAIEAQQLRAADPALAAQLAVAAYRIAPTVQARSTLIEATAGELPTRLLGPVGPDFVAESATLLAVAQSSTDTVQLYSLVRGHPTEAARVAAGPRSQQDFAVALDPGGKLLAVGNTAGDVMVWNVSSPAHPQRVAKLVGRSGAPSTVYAVAFGPGGHQLAAAYDNGTVGQWDIADPARPRAEPTVHVPGAPAMKAVAFNSDGMLAAAAGEKGALVTWTPGHAHLAMVPGGGTTTLEAVAFSPGGTTLVTGGDDGEVRLWRVASTGQLTPARPALSPGPSYVTCLAFSPSGSSLAACSDNGAVVLYDTKSWHEEASYPVPNPPTGAAFSARGTTLTTGDAGGAIRIWRLPTPSSYHTGGSVFALQYTSSGSELAAVSDGTRGDVTFWNTSDPLRPKEVAAVRGPAGFGPVAGAGALSPNGRLLAVADATARIQLLDVADPLHPISLGPALAGSRPLVEQMVFSPSGTVLAAGDDSGHIRMWDVANPARPRLLASFADGTGEVLGLAFSHGGAVLAAASSDSKVRLWGVANPHRPTLLSTVGGFSSYAYSAAFTPDGHTLVAGSADGTLRVWDVANPAHPALEGGPLTGLTGGVYQLALSPDGHTLAAVTTDHMVGLWDIADPAHPVLEATLDTGSGALFSLGFDPHQPVLVASGDDQTLSLWDYRPADAVRLVCAATGVPVTRSEWAEYVEGVPYRPPCSTKA